MIDYQNIYDDVCRIISEHFNIDKTSLSPDIQYVKDLNADSVDMLTLLLLFEEEFKIPISFNKGLYTISDSIDYIQSQLTIAK